jgi:hypothetical protein
MLNRIYAHWVYGGFLAGLLLMACMPLFTADWSPILKVCYLTLLVYMVHQLEEWDDGTQVARRTAEMKKPNREVGLSH